ncbi:helix-turn-helix domain-containing protein [Faecalibaculum rodentium]|jgi:transcriptional regulator with XRE-family HTH domain|uniref:helix-turn-helix domain-containing protein n=1 Tax=Faecalibaculum rodentium TaxID=1702221 RepID=UPI00258A6A4B|nr:helix-turn-helix transcriptional regulator [Faecalibaculum rodentium]
MIFAEKIITLRKRNGWSQEDLAARVNVSRQAVAKWEASQSIPSLDKIVQLSLIFGVTTDYLLKEEEEEISLTQDSPESSIRHVTLQEAGSYLETRRSAAWVCAIATALCILSPVTVIALGAFSEYGHIHISENTAGAIGLIVLLLMVGIAVGLFIWNDQVRNKPWEFLEHDPFVLDYGVRGLVKEQQAAFAPAKLALTIIGVILLILSPVAIFGAIFTDKDLYMALSVCVTLILVAAGVFLLILADIPSEAADRLLQEGDYTPDKKRSNSVLGPLSGAYWLIATAIYLLWSFRTENWGTTWMVWPVAGLLFAALRAIVEAVMKNRGETQERIR